jgi:phosphoribosylformylglycinamidine synthase
VALAESCISGQQGAEITLGQLSDDLAHPRWDRLLFGEGGARILVSVAPNAVLDWELYLKTHLQAHWQRLGRVGTETEIETLHIKLADQVLIDLPIATMQTAWAEAIERRLQG